MKDSLIDLKKNFENIFNNFENPVLLVDDKGNILRCNNSTKKLFEISIEEKIDSIIEINFPANVLKLKDGSSVKFNFKKIELDQKTNLLI